MMKKITRRSFLSICGAAAAAAALTACGGAASSAAASSTAVSSTAESAASGAALSGNVATGGSTSMKNVIAALTEGFAEIEPDVTVSYDPTGSGAGITGATDKTLDIGLSSRALKDDETGVTGTIVALDGIAIIVNKDSKVEDLTVDQLKQKTAYEMLRSLVGSEMCIRDSIYLTSVGIRPCSASLTQFIFCLFAFLLGEKPSNLTWVLLNCILTLS